MKMNIYKLVMKCLTLLGIWLALYACQNETWDEHYEVDSTTSDLLLYEMIEQDPELSTFARYLQETGYDTVLLTNQAYTVWAPSNTAFEAYTSDILNDADKLKELIENHLAMFSYTSVNIPEDELVLMFNSKNVSYTNMGSLQMFSDATVTDGDILTQNGVLHKIDQVVEQRANIWSYLNSTTDYGVLMDYLSATNYVTFDKENSVVTGQNSLGQSEYDSIFVVSNTYFDIVGHLDYEDEQYTFLSLTDEVYESAFETLSAYYNHPVDTISSYYTDLAIFNNLVFDYFSLSDLTAYPMVNTYGNTATISSSMIAKEEPLSNGSLLEMSEFIYTPQDLIYKPIRYELENTDRRSTGYSLTGVTFSKVYDIEASGLFTNIVTLNETPNDSNDYFEVYFSDVLSADYNLEVKFSPSGDIQNTKLLFEVSTFQTDTAGVLTEMVYASDSTLVINRDLDEVLQIGDVYANDVFVDDDTSNEYFVKVKVTIDVSDAETILYSRKVGIDYLELVPVD